MTPTILDFDKAIETKTPAEIANEKAIHHNEQVNKRMIEKISFGSKVEIEFTERGNAHYFGSRATPSDDFKELFSRIDNYLLKMLQLKEDVENTDKYGAPLSYEEIMEKTESLPEIAIKTVAIKWGWFGEDMDVKSIQVDFAISSNGTFKCKSPEIKLDEATGDLEYDIKELIGQASRYVDTASADVDQLDLFESNSGDVA